MKKNILIILLIGIILGSLCACDSRVEKSVDEAIEKTSPESDQQENAKSLSEIGVAKKESKEDSFSNDLKRAIVKDGNVLYSKADNRLTSLNLLDGTESTLYETTDDGRITDYFVYGNMIYLLDYNNTDDVDSTTSLYKMNTDGSEKKLLIDDLDGGDWQVYVYENDLYLINWDMHRCYALLEDGCLGKQIGDEHSVYQYLSTSESEVWSGEKILSVPYCLERFNCIWVQNARGSNKLIHIQPDDGSKQIADLPDGCNVQAITDSYIVSMKYGEDKDIFYLTDVKTGKSKIWFRENANYISFDELGCYFSVASKDEEGNTDYAYEKVAWDGTKSVLFTASVVPGMYVETSNGISDFTVIGDKVYYHYADADRMYLMCRNLDSPEQVTKLGDSYDDKMYSKVGHVEAYCDEVYASSDPDQKILDVYAEHLVFDGGSVADEKINETLKTIQKEEIEQAVAIARSEEKTFEEVSMASYAHTSTVMGLTFLSDKYACIYQYGYDETGGAHGMPYKKYYMFNLTTGAQLTLKDIVGNTETEVHDTILTYFSDMISENPGEYDGDAESIVNQSAGFASPFYLTMEGIGFYYAPYDLACYAAGFQDVIIPYSEFDMMIDLSIAENTKVSSEAGMH